MSMPHPECCTCDQCKLGRVAAEYTRLYHNARDDLAAAQARIGELEAALRGLIDAYDANYPPASEGHAAQAAWSRRRTGATIAARAALSAGSTDERRGE